MRYQWTRKLIGVEKIDRQIIAEANFKAGDKVMDVGCGQGLLLGMIHKQYGDNLEYMGIEPDEKTRQLAEKKYGDKGIKFKRAFADHLPSVQDYYTHVICMVSFHHFPRDTWEASIQELKRVLAPGGKLIIVDFGRPTGLWGRFLSVVNPCRKLSKGVDDLLKQAGFTEKTRQFGYISHYVFRK